MSTAPYQTTFIRDGDLCFLADVPALAHIGARFDELTQSSAHYEAPPAEQGQFRRLCARLRELIDAAAAGGSDDWPAIQRQLTVEFGECFAHAQRRVMRNIDEYFQSGQMPLAEYLEWQLHGAETLWSMNGGGEYGLDKAAFEARVERLTQRLQQAGYQTAAERRYRQESPERYEFMQRSLGLLNQSLSNDDPPDLESLATQQMELFRQSPFFAQAQGMLDQMRERLEPLRQTDPELYQQQVANFENMRRFAEDPASVVRELTSSLPTIPFAAEEVDDCRDDDESAGASEQPAAVPGRFTFNCGRRKQPSKRQIALFQELISRQDALRPGIEQALRALHDQMGPGDPALSPGDRLLFPKNPDKTDVPLNCFYIRQISLEDEKPGRVVLNLDSQFGHFDEHGCHIAIRNGVVGPFGTWDDVYGD